MSSSEKRAALLALRLIAAKADKLADDLEHSRLWEGDLSRGLGEIQVALEDARRARPAVPILR